MVREIYRETMHIIGSIFSEGSEVNRCGATIADTKSNNTNYYNSIIKVVLLIIDTSYK